MAWEGKVAERECGGVTVLEATGSTQKHKAPSSSGPSLGSHSTPEGPSSPPPAPTPLTPPGLGFIHNLSVLGGRPVSPEPLKSALGGSQTTAWLLVPGPLPALESGSNQLCQTARGYSAT